MKKLWIPAALAVLVAAGGCAFLEVRYDASIYDSAIYRASHASELWPITEPTVMASFSSCWLCGESGGNCSAKCGYEAGRQTVKYDVWVSDAEQVLGFCKDFDDVVLGMQQLQGLPPNVDQPADSWKFLVVKVGPKSLFRPCPDPDPTKKGPCPPVFPCFYPSKEMDCSAERKAEVQSHKAWMATQALNVWQVPNGYPWTRLGYTYNWDPKAASIVGTSEYVIPGGTEIQVCGLVSAVSTCRAGKLPDGICGE